MASRPKGASSSEWCLVPPAASMREIALRRSRRCGLLVDAVERVHQAVAEGIGVDVEGRVDEVGDVGPEGLVARTEPDRRARGFPPAPPARSRRAARRSVRRLRRSVWTLALEGVEGDLAHDRIDHVLDLGGEHAPCARAWSRGLGEQRAEGQHLAEDATPSRPASAASAPSARRSAPASTWCTPWPSSWASVITSRGLPW